MNDTAVTEKAPAEQQQLQIQDFLLLQRVAQRISAILDLDALLEQIVEDVAQTFGYSRSAILFVDAAAGEVVIAAVRGWSTNYHVKGDRFKIGEGMVGHVAKTGRICYVPNVAEVPHCMVSEESTRSEVAIPIKSCGRTIGVFNVQHADVDAFPPHRLRLLEALAGHVGVAIENARLFERERFEKEGMMQGLAEARAIQARLLPERAPEVPHFRLSGLSKPCLAVGGDWYDYIPLSDGRVAIVLGDVVGKGPGAALLMASTRSILRMYAEQGGTPGAVLTKVNRALRADLPPGKFVTVIYAVLDPDRRTLAFQRRTSSSRRCRCGGRARRKDAAGTAARHHAGELRRARTEAGRGRAPVSLFRRRRRSAESHFRRIWRSPPAPPRRRSLRLR